VRVVLGSATVLACLGLKAVFDSHSYAEPAIPHLYSLHSWMGLSAVALAVAQWILGKQLNLPRSNHPYSKSLSFFILIAEAEAYSTIKQFFFSYCMQTIKHDKTGQFTRKYCIHK
jgi:hypothetical protein